MRRSYFLSRRLHSRTRHPRRHSRSQRHPSKHHSRRHRRYHHTYRRSRRGHHGHRGGMVETVSTMYGIPVSADALVTNSKGVTRSVKNRVMSWNDAETSGLKGDDDI